MVTKEQAQVESHFHYGECVRTIGPRGGETLKQENWRRSGMTKTWKTRPDEFSVPIKYGLYNSSYLTHSNASEFHTAANCAPTVIGDRKNAVFEAPIGK